MAKSIMYRLFKMGRIPKNIDRSSLITFDEGVSIVIHYINFKSPGKRFSNKKRMFLGLIMTTSGQIIAFVSKHQLLNLKLDDERLKKIDFSQSSPEKLIMHFDVSLFSDDSSGMVTYTFKTPVADKILERIQDSA